MTEWKLFHNSQEAWDSMYADCERAKRSIDVEQYIFCDDPVGQRFFEMLKRKAKAGIKVRILCDMVGSYDMYESSREEDLRKAGIQLLFVHPISAWRIPYITSWFFRDHRKVWIVDGVVGYTGGMNIGEKYTEWRDTQIRVSGPIVKHMEEAFDSMWNSVLKGKLPWIERSQPSVDNFSFLTTGAKFRQRRFYKNLSKALKKSKKYAYFTTPYFVPPYRLFRKLRLAVLRGVDVRLIVNKKSDSRVVDTASESLYTMALKAGIRLYQYNPAVMHAKICIIDDTWATVGSTNFDNLSFKFNYEANVVTTDPKCLQELKEQFSEDLRNSKELVLSEWERRSFLSKILEICTWPAHWIL